MKGEKHTHDIIVEELYARQQHSEEEIKGVSERVKEDFPRLVDSMKRTFKDQEYEKTIFGYKFPKTEYTSSNGLLECQIYYCAETPGFSAEELGDNTIAQISMWVDYGNDSNPTIIGSLSANGALITNGQQGDLKPAGHGEYNFLYQTLLYDYLDEFKTETE